MVSPQLPRPDNLGVTHETNSQTNTRKPDHHRRFSERSDLFSAAGRRQSVRLSLSRLNHRLPRGQAYPEVVQGTAEFHHQITDTLLPQADPVLHDAAALDT